MIDREREVEDMLCILWYCMVDRGRKEGGRSGLVGWWLFLCRQPTPTWRSVSGKT